MNTHTPTPCYLGVTFLAQPSQTKAFRDVLNHSLRDACLPCFQSYREAIEQILDWDASLQSGSSPTQQQPCSTPIDAAEIATRSFAEGPPGLERALAHGSGDGSACPSCTRSSLRQIEQRLLHEAKPRLIQAHSKDGERQALAVLRRPNLGFIVNVAALFLVVLLTTLLVNERHDKREPVRLEDHQVPPAGLLALDKSVLQPEMDEALLGLAEALIPSGNVEKALEYLNAAEHLAQQGKNKETALKVSIRRAWIMKDSVKETSRLGRARAEFSRVLQLASENPASLIQAGRAHCGLGWCAIDEGKNASDLAEAKVLFGRAREHFDKALTAAGADHEEIQFLELMMDAQGGKGWAEYYVSNLNTEQDKRVIPKEASLAWEQALGVARKAIGMEVLTRSVAYRFSDAFFASMTRAKHAADPAEKARELNRAQDHVAEASRYFERVNFRVGIGDCHLALGLLHLNCVHPAPASFQGRTGECDTAEAELHQALVVFGTLRNVDKECEARLTLSRLLARCGKEAAAHLEAKAAVAACVKIGKEVPPDIQALAER